MTNDNQHSTDTDQKVKCPLSAREFARSTGNIASVASWDQREICCILDQWEAARWETSNPPDWQRAIPLLWNGNAATAEDAFRAVWRRRYQHLRTPEPCRSLRAAAMLHSALAHHFVLPHEQDVENLTRGQVIEREEARIAADTGASVVYSDYMKLSIKELTRAKERDVFDYAAFKEGLVK